MARDEAKRLLGKVAAGEDPAGTKKLARDATTVTELCEIYLADVKQGAC